MIAVKCLSTSSLCSFCFYFPWDGWAHSTLRKLHCCHGRVSEKIRLRFTFTCLVFSRAIFIFIYLFFFFEISYELSNGHFYIEKTTLLPWKSLRENQTEIYIHMFGVFKGNLYFISFIFFFFFEISYELSNGYFTCKVNPFFFQKILCCLLLLWEFSINRISESASFFSYSKVVIPWRTSC